MTIDAWSNATPALTDLLDDRWDERDDGKCKKCDRDFPRYQIRNLCLASGGLRGYQHAVHALAEIGIGECAG